MNLYPCGAIKYGNLEKLTFTVLPEEASFGRPEGTNIENNKEF